MTAPDRGVSIDRYGRRSKPPTRELIIEAAIVLLGSQGVRRLTHRRVDAEAGLPEGTTSFHFRTSDALTLATLEGIVDRERALIEGLPKAETPDGVVVAISALLTALADPFRELVVARHALVLDARNRPALLDLIERAQTDLRTSIAAVFADGGAEDPAEATAFVLPVLDGLLLHCALGLTDADHARRRIEREVRAAMHG